MAQPKKKPAATADKTKPPRFTVVGKEPQPTGLNLGGLRKASGKTSGAAKHPIVTVGAEALELLGQFVEYWPEFARLDALVGSKGSVKAQLAPHIKQTYFARFAGGAPDSTMLVDVPFKRDGKPGVHQVKLVTQARYATKCTDLAALGDAAEHFRMSTVVKIDMAKIPEAKQQPLVDAILAAAEKHGIEEGIDYTQCVQPKAGFHEARTTLFTPERNLDIDAEIPVTVFPKF